MKIDDIEQIEVSIGESDSELIKRLLTIILDKQ